MKVYVITTRRIGDKYIFNSSNRFEIGEYQRANNIDFRDLNYDCKDERISHKYYYKFNDNNCAIIGYAHLPGNDNHRRVEMWKEWLKTLCQGDEYTFILHDKDYTNNDTPFQSFKKNESDTYIFFHKKDDFFYKLLIDIEEKGNVSASDFDNRFQKLVELTNIKNEIDESRKDNKIPDRNIFLTISKLLDDNDYVNQYDKMIKDENNVQDLLIKTRDKIREIISRCEY